MGRTIRINGIDVPVIEDQLSGREIKRQAGIPRDRVLVRQEADANTIVPDDQRIRVADRESFTHHARHSKAGGRGARVRREAAQLAAGYPGLSVAKDDSYVHIPDFRLPRQWTPRRTQVLIMPPVNYPEAAPDGFFLGADLRRRDGLRTRTPGHYFRDYKNPFADAGYHWYCLEDPDRLWDPRHDSLVSFVEAIRTYLGTAD
ncbi:E2/UBC family protein [Actinokineospora sp. G85]|uniref:E2/UBC family protein n=1 Tax=Actinokineospora sp. G85 TaxID=3406626 RepID=UPI003C73F676